LNGTVNPNSNATNYYFEYGTSGSYGSQTPASPASVGSDLTDHVVSQALTGLSPNTTYHYRLVAVDAIGFTTFGADIGLTTAAAAAAPTAPARPTPAKRKKCKKGKKLKHGKCVKKKRKRHRHHKS
jgi:phosphodiesterase/alkaline phosphatase D-like protein